MNQPILKPGDRRPLGRTGILVSPLALGLVKLGRNRGVKYPEHEELPDDAAARALLESAITAGITLLDTAPAYGTSEERLGALLESMGLNRRRREEIVIATKAGEEFDGERSAFDFSAAALRASLERSLRRLRVERIDCVLLHSDGLVEISPARDEALGALHEMKRRGVVRAVGMSTKTAAGAAYAIEHGDVVMLTLSPVDQADEPMLRAAFERGCGVLIKKALASGHLGKLSAGAATGVTGEGAGGGVGSGGGKGGREPVESALRFVFDHDGVSSVVVGTSKADHVRSNAAAAAAALAGARGLLPLSR